MCSRLFQQRLTGADERGVRKVEPIGRSSRMRTGRRISGGRSDTEVGQCSLGGAYGQKQCSRAGDDTYYAKTSRRWQGCPAMNLDELGVDGHLPVHIT